MFIVQPEITLVLLAFCKVKALCCWAAGLRWGAGGAGQVSTQQKMCSHKVTQVLLAAWHLLKCGGCLRQARSDSWCTAGSCLGSKVQTWQRQFLGTLDPAQACCLARCVQCCGELLRLCYKSTYTASRSASTAVETGVHCPLRHRWGSLCSTLCSAPGGTLWVPLTAAWAC